MDQAGIYSMENPECTSNRNCLLLIQHWDQFLGILRAALALDISQAASSSHAANAVFAPAIETLISKTWGDGNDLWEENWFFFA